MVTCCNSSCEGAEARDWDMAVISGVLWLGLGGLMRQQCTGQESRAVYVDARSNDAA